MQVNKTLANRVVNFNQTNVPYLLRALDYPEEGRDCLFSDAIWFYYSLYHINMIVVLLSHSNNRQTLYFTSKKPTCVFLTPFSENKGGGKKGKGRRGEEREGKINKRNFPFKCLACKEERERKIAYWQVPLSIFSPFPLNLGGKSLGGKWIPLSFPPTQFTSAKQCISVPCSDSLIIFPFIPSPLKLKLV